MKRTQMKIQCPSCHNSTNSLDIYSCCFQFKCQSCPSQLHAGTCQFSKKLTNINIDHIYGKHVDPSCNRCQSQGLHKSFKYCQQCQKTYCNKCFEEIHNKNKFLMHQTNRLEISDQTKLICEVHFKSKSLFCQQFGIICSACVADLKSCRAKNVCGLQLRKIKQQSENIHFNLGLAQQNQLHKFRELQSVLDNSYKKILGQLQQRYHYNLSLLQKTKINFIQNIQGLIQKSTNIAKQLKALESIKSIAKEPVLIRTFVLNQSMKKIKKQSNLLLQQQAKILCPDEQLRQAFCKKFVFIKTKIKNDEQQKENKSLRKSRIQSLSRSVNKSQLKRQNSSKSILKNLNMNSQYSSQLTTSMKKMTNSIRDTAQCLKNIPSIALDFSIKSPTPMKEKQIPILTVQSEASFGSFIDEVRNKPKPNYLKRKSDYLDMRDRMRKPTIANRFQIN